MIYVFSKTCDIELLAYLDIVTRWRESFRRIQHRCGIKRSNLERIDDLTTGPRCLYACVCALYLRGWHTFYPFRIHKLLFREADIHVHMEGREEEIWKQ